MENWTNLDKGREGVKNPGNFADIICTWLLSEQILTHSIIIRQWGAIILTSVPVLLLKKLVFK